MRHPVGDRHLAGQDEGDRAGEQPEQQQDAAEELEHAGEAEQREQLGLRTVRRREAEQLLRAVLHEDQRRDDAQDG